ncbi:hypothetical protein HN018_03315 [Lichenicola cladoniae]|uniref:Uncharacterized protein n=1 Tax=Lichenicola cladoniae TaxID=1484109 RepID=A0A6M8HLH7_9PROT|nr:hypothetical protein [Lichenicola cladoniae]NPD70457.1 hypothetical protein [Acetobacteraceae bacterium]QKE89201.1 hypothetical protein HN018_03315 [Lichenicola cladoniae]
MAFIGLTPAAYAQQQSGMSNMSGMSGPKMQGMTGTQGSSMGVALHENLGQDF